MKFTVNSLLLLASFTVSAQSDSLPSNSFQDHYRKSNPALIYSYDTTTQTHNYSDNWDFDHDGLKDEVYFCGTGGAHLYYFLKVVLSSNKSGQKFDFIQTDFPCLIATDTTALQNSPSGFRVVDFGDKLGICLIVTIDEATKDAFRNNLSRQKLRTKHILIRFENGVAKFESL